MVEITHQLPCADAPAPLATVLQQLRTATAVRHRALEARLPLTHSRLDLDTYKRIIEAYYGFHLPLQQLIERFLAPHAIDPARQKIPSLIKDLHALGLSDTQIYALPQCRELPAIGSIAQLLGVMYVMEGATLGGQVLRRIIADKLGIDADSGGEFLDVYGRDTGRLWKAFLKQLAEFDTPLHNAEVVQAACATFDCFQTWLEQARVLNDA
ncbi:biliverdin-producing heme oxygenase [Pseudomonas sp. KU26590]|uniref:biliverdin-producing heme oxygenase n=1 Tax=Pseudomonas sp. KU26590 TaxID=2991051 RepID=UPI00223D2192|nr:biliverdin-producing heme oxygenase [Pseudomonas sp. KU26590]UZJ62661.1 biliverdin-producing heme oxygenase [Pseudomonas sp. KU26590]